MTEKRDYRDTVFLPKTEFPMKADLARREPEILARWAAEDLRPIDLHECRHTFASLLIAAGVNAKAVSTFCGHSSIQVTFDLYGKLMPGSEDEAATLVTRYLSGYTIPDTTDTGNPHG